MGRSRKLLIAAAALVIVYALVGFFAVPAFLRPFLETKLTEALHRQVRIRKIYLNPFALSAKVSGLAVSEPSGGEPFASAEEVYANAQLSSLWKRALVLREARLGQPFVRIVRVGGGRYNFSDLLQPKADKGGEPFRFFLGNIQITGGGADFLDRSTGNLHTVRELEVSLPFLSNTSAHVETFTRPALSAKIDGSPFSLQGESKPFADSLETSVKLALRELDVPRALDLVELPWEARLASARLDLNLQVTYVQYRDRSPTLQLAGDAEVRDVVVEEAGGEPIARLPRTAVAFGPMEVFSRSFRVTRLEIEKPDLHLRRRADGAWNWEALLPERGEEAAPPARESTKPVDYLVDEISIAGGTVAFEDAAAKGSFRTVLSPVELSVRNLTGRSGELATVSLGLTTEKSEKLHAEGKLGLSPFSSQGTVQLDGLRLEKYEPYYGRHVLAMASGGLSLGTRYTYGAKGDGPALRLEGLGARLASLEVRKAGEKEAFLRLPQLEVRDSVLDFGAQRVMVRSLATRGASLSLRRTAEGLDLQHLTPPPAEPTPGEAASEKAAGPGKPWTFILTSGSVRDYQIRWVDETPADPVRLLLSGLAVEGANLSTEPNAKGRVSVSAAVNGSGSISIKGPLTLKPLGGRLDVAAKNLEIAPFQNYFTERLRVLITSGAVSSAGQVSLTTGRDQKTSAGFQGDINVTGLEAADKVRADGLLSYSSLALTGIAAQQSPPALRVEGVSLAGFSTALTVEEDGSLNLLRVLRSPSEDSPRPPSQPKNPDAPAKESPRLRIEIPAVTLQGGTVKFIDRHVKPAYTADLTEIGGRVSGLSSEETRFADVDLRGKFNGYAPLQITGKINPLREDLFVDLKASFEGADLSPVTPYTSRYVGYTVQKGKLSFDLTYKIVESKLTSENIILLDQFYLGDKVDSPEATSLPLKLGLALLRDREGKIRLDIPVEGELSDPDFRLGKVIWRAVVNLITKAVSAPFALLGSLFGSGAEQLGHVDFAAGSVAIAEDQAKKIDTLAKALQERPDLQLEITGHADSEADRAAVADRLFLRKLKVQKMKEILKGGESSGSVDAVTIAPEEVGKYLTLAYRAEPFPKPKNPEGGEKELPPLEMEKLLRAQIQVKDDELRALASQRAATVREALLQTGLVPPQRVFAVEGPLVPRGEEKAPLSRVDFHLK